MPTKARARASALRLLNEKLLVERSGECRRCLAVVQVKTELQMKTENSLWNTGPCVQACNLSHLGFISIGQCSSRLSMKTFEISGLKVMPYPVECGCWYKYGWLHIEFSPSVSLLELRTT